MQRANQFSAHWAALLRGSLTGILQWAFASFWLSVRLDSLPRAFILALSIALPIALFATYCHYSAIQNPTRRDLAFLDALLTILNILIVGAATYPKLVGPAA